MTRQNAELRAIRAAEKAQEEQEEERIRFHAAEMERITSLRRQHEAYKHDQKMKTVQRMIDEVRRRRGRRQHGWGLGGGRVAVGPCQSACTAGIQPGPPRPAPARRLGV